MINFSTEGTIILGIVFLLGILLFLVQKKIINRKNSIITVKLIPFYVVLLLNVVNLLLALFDSEWHGNAMDIVFGIPSFVLLVFVSLPLLLNIIKKDK